MLIVLGGVVAAASGIVGYLARRRCSSKTNRTSNASNNTENSKREQFKSTVYSIEEFRGLVDNCTGLVPGSVIAGTRAFLSFLEEREVSVHQNTMHGARNLGSRAPGGGKEGQGLVTPGPLHRDRGKDR